MDDVTGNVTSEYWHSLSGDTKALINGSTTLGSFVFPIERFVSIGSRVVNSTETVLGGAIDGGSIGYHATRPDVVPLIVENGFRPGTNPGRLGSGGTYVNNTPEGALAEFFHINPNATEVTLIKVRYDSGNSATSSVSPANTYGFDNVINNIGADVKVRPDLPDLIDYHMNFPLWNIDSISAPSIRAPGTINTHILNNSLQLVEIKAIKR